MGWPSFSGLGHPTGPDRRSTIDEVRDRLRIMGSLPKIRTPGAQTGRCARRRATITACPVGWDRRPTRSQRDFVDRSRSAQCAQPGRVRARMRSSGGSDHRRNCHHCIKRQLPAINVRNSPRSARGAVRACNRWRAAGRAGRPRRDRSPPRGAPVRRRRPQCHGHAGSPRPRCQPDWLWRSRSCRPRAPP